jgi:hypothetical protein
LPARFDDTEIPGILPTIGYVDLNEFTPEKFAELIKMKIGPIFRANFFPEDPDLLYKILKNKDKKSKKMTLVSAYEFYTSMKLMTEEERVFLVKLIMASCPCGRPNDIHQDLELLERIISVGPDEIKQKLSRLSCLYFKTTVEEDKDKSEYLCTHGKAIRMKFLPVYNNKVINATNVVYAILDVIFGRSCPDCAWNAISTVDFSDLSTLTGFDEQNTSDLSE